jgi:hypothetical protein
VKFINADGQKFSFEIERRERQMLFRLLELYPMVPVAHQKLSKTGDRSEDQQLLEETLAQERKKNKKLVLAMLKAKSVFRESEQGYLFALKGQQMEWLLQVLNDVRVGCWLMLGSPDGPVQTLAMINQNTAPYFWAMEVAGDFQMVLIHAMNRS